MNSTLSAETPVTESAAPKLAQQRGLQSSSGDRLDASKQTLLGKKLGRAALREAVAKRHAKMLKQLPGGVFNAPKVTAVVERMMERFVATGLVDANLSFDVMLASAPEINGWVQMDHEITDAKVFYITLTKGILDLASDTPMARRILGPELAAEVAKNGEAVIAAILAHELGHAMNGDLEKTRMTTRVFNEMDADTFSVRLLAAAGYAPEAAITLMECLEKLHTGNESLAQKFAQLNDEHPKPRFRVANIVDLVETLKRTPTARAEFGLDPRGASAIEPRPLPRDAAHERVSKQGVEGVQRRLSRPDYVNAPLREKLNVLEQYFATPNARIDGMARQAAVTLVRGYAEVLNGCTSLAEIDLVVDSFGRFEGNAQGLTRANGDHADVNVRAASRKLKADALVRKVAIIEAQIGEPLSVKTFDAFVPHVDRRALSGMLMRSCRNASSLDEIAAIIYARNDAGARLRDDRAGTRSAESTDHAVYRAAIERAIDLTGDLGATLDFMQRTLTLKKVVTPRDEGPDDIKITLPGEQQIFAGLVRRALERPGIELASFVERMQRPRTAADRAYSDCLRNCANEILPRIARERGETADLKAGGSTFSYGVGRSHVLPRAVSTDLIALVQLVGGASGVQVYFNRLAGRQYALPEALTAIAYAKPERRAAWDALAPSLLHGRDARRGDDLQSQLRVIVQRLVDVGAVSAADVPAKLAELEHTSDPYLADVYATYKNARHVHYAMIRDLLATINATPDVERPQFEGSGRISRIDVPRINAANIDLIPREERVAYFAERAREHTVRTLTKFGPQVERYREVYTNGLDELIEDERLTPAAKDELLAAIDDLTARARDVANGGGADLDPETHIARRRLRLMLDVCADNTIGLRSRLTEASYEALRGLCGLHDRPTDVGNARQLLSTLLVTNEGALQRYLEDPQAGGAEGLSLDLARELVGVIALYEGIGSLDAPGQIFGFDPPRLFARQVNAPRIAAGGKEREQIAFIDAAILGKEGQATLAPFGEAFRALVAGSGDNARHGWSDAKWYKALLKEAWPYVLHRGLTEADPVDALGFTLGYMQECGQSTEIVNKLMFAMMTRALDRVSTKADMDVFASLFALYVTSPQARLDTSSFFKADPKEIAKLGQLRYREKFYARFMDELQHHGSWRGERASVGSTISTMFAKAARRLHDRAERWRMANAPSADPVLTSFWALKKTVFPALTDAPWFTKLIGGIKRVSAEAYTRALAEVGYDVGRFSREKLFIALQSTSPWSERTDNAIADYVRAGKFEQAHSTSAKREQAVRLTRHVKSLPLREELYRDVLKTYGYPSASLLQRAKNYAKLYQAYVRARDVWTEPVLADLQKAGSLIEAWKISEHAWESGVKNRAADRGIGKDKAMMFLMDLAKAKAVVDSPAAGEIDSVFPEASRHRDGFLEKYVKTRPTTLEQLKTYQSHKSRETETPYHKVAKGFFEFVDGEATRLSTVERADLALYLAGVKADMEPQTSSALRHILDGNTKRRKVAALAGGRLTPAEIRTFTAQAHPEEKLVAFRGMLLGGIIGDTRAESILADQLLFQDPTMPKYLRKLLKMFLTLVNNEERSVYLAWLLASSNGKPLSGPEIVKSLIEKGGVVAAKVAQLVASYGFNLPPEYQEALEKFKGKAQEVEKLAFMEEVRKRLPADKAAQIKTLDQELGSGSFKIGYRATLEDGRKVVIMMPRAYVIERTAREFEITRRMLDAIMEDPELARDNFGPLRSEVERIVKGEMHFASEAAFMQAHKENYEARPWLVRQFGNDVGVCVPQPLTDWSNEDILVEEYVDSKGFSQLPARSMFGWSQEKLAKAALSEVLSQLMAFSDPSRLVGGKVTLDIDPHEENQLAKGNLFVKQMVNIDLGQSVAIEPDEVRGIVQMLAFIRFGKIDEAVAKADTYMDFASPAERETFHLALAAKRGVNGDPFEVLGQTLEETGLKGVFLKPQYLYFQKLFATIVGLKRHIRNPSFIMRKSEQLFALQAASAPSVGVREVKQGWLELRRLARAS